MTVHSTAQEVLLDVGLNPDCDDALPRIEAAIREIIHDYNGSDVEVEGESLSAPGVPKMEDDPDDAFMFEDGSFLLRFGAQWMATDIVGVDRDKTRWEVADHPNN